MFGAILKATNSLFRKLWHFVVAYILKAIKNATGTSVIFPTNISLIIFVLVLPSVPNIGECLTKT